MNGEKDFLERRLQEALFLFRLIDRYKEKMPRDPLAQTLALEYKEKYEKLLKEYMSVYGKNTEENESEIEQTSNLL